jgi:hypothetical protein
MATIVCISETTICKPEAIAGGSGAIVSNSESIGSWMAVIVDRVKTHASHSSTIAGDLDIFANEAELIVTKPTTISSKGKTGEKEAGKPGVFDVKLSAGLVWIVVFPFMPPYGASRLPFLTRWAF